MKCVWCGEELKFDKKKGWVHQDGEIYKQRPDGRDDHCVLPEAEQFTTSAYDEPEWKGMKEKCSEKT